MPNQSLITKETRLHDLRSTREGLKIFSKLMAQGFEFHKDPRGECLLKSMEKYIATLEREIKILEHTKDER
jgi:hypothetical protein